MVVFGLQGLLGDAKTFKLEFEKRITAGNDKNATGRDRQIATAKAAELRACIAPFFLRREKKDVLPSNDRYIHDMSEVSCCMLTGPTPALISPYHLFINCILYNLPSQGHYTPALISHYRSQSYPDSCTLKDCHYKVSVLLHLPLQSQHLQATSDMSNALTHQP